MKQQLGKGSMSRYIRRLSKECMKIDQLIASLGMTDKQYNRAIDLSTIFPYSLYEIISTRAFLLSDSEIENRIKSNVWLGE